MGNLDASYCTHFMYGFATVKPDGRGSFKLESNDPNADHPTGHTAQTSLCPETCNDPNFQPNWSDPVGERCQWPCAPDREYRGYEGLTVGMKRRNPNLKGLISVGGWNFNDCRASPANTVGQGSATCEIFSTIAASETMTRAFASNIIDFCRAWGFDGFDLDWEYPVKAGHNDNQTLGETPQDFANYIRMLRILKEEFAKESSANSLLLTAAVGVGQDTVEVAYDIPGMSQHLDLINLMTYDLHGAWEDRTGCNAPLYTTEEDRQLAGYDLSVSWAVDYWLNAGARPSQLTIGLGMYGRGWRLTSSENTGFNAPASGACAKGPSTGEAGYRAFYEIEAEIAAGATKFYDEERQCPYIVSGQEWIGYDDPRSICAKVQFAQNRNLAGAMLWALDLDDFAGAYGNMEYPLVSIAGQGGGALCGR